MGTLNFAWITIIGSIIGKGGFPRVGDLSGDGLKAKSSSVHSQLAGVGADAFVRPASEACVRFWFAGIESTFPFTIST